MKHTRRTLTIAAALAVFILLALGASAQEVWLWPVAGCTNMSRGYSSGHNGLDILPGSTIRAAKDGTVVTVRSGCKNYSGAASGGSSCSKAKGCACNNLYENTTYKRWFCNYGTGNGVTIKHSNGSYSHYAHMSSVSVSVGQSVKAGQSIGVMGSSGCSTGKHLHFSLQTGTTSGTRYNNNPTNSGFTQKGKAYTDPNGVYYTMNTGSTKPKKPELDIRDRMSCEREVAFSWSWEMSGSVTTSYNNFLVRDAAGNAVIDEKKKIGAVWGLYPLEIGRYTAVLTAVNSATGEETSSDAKTIVVTDHNYSNSGFDPAHPHKKYLQCACGEKKYTGEYATVNGCPECAAQDGGDNSDGAETPGSNDEYDWDDEDYGIRNYEEDDSLIDSDPETGAFLVKVKKKLRLVCNLKDEWDGAKVTWKTAQKKIASVSRRKDGSVVIKGKKAGMTKITATVTRRGAVLYTETVDLKVAKKMPAY